MTDETGFHTVPWDLYIANDGHLDGLPDKDWSNPGGDCCDSNWAGPLDEPDEDPWACCLPPDHPGTHKASDSVGVLAEWRDEDQLEE